MINKIKPIKQLYKEASIYDLVITNDAPLNTALNREINKPQLGKFALTCQNIGSKYSNYLYTSENIENFDLVLLICDKLKYNYKQSLYYVQNVMRVWKTLGSHSAAIEYLSDDEKKVLDVLVTVSTSEMAMEKCDISFLKRNKVCSIGESMFNNLDKCVLPSEFESIDVFTDDSLDLKSEKLYLFNSQKSIIDKTVSMIKSAIEDNKDSNKNEVSGSSPSNISNSVAIVLDLKSDYLPVLKAKLINNNISINETLNLVDSFRLREYISLLDLAFNRHNLKVSDVYASSDLFGFDINEKYYNYNFNDICKRDEKCSKFNSFLDELLNGTFGDLFDKFSERSSDTSFSSFSEVSLPVELMELLYKINLFDKKLSVDDLIDLKFCIENFDITLSQERSGVLLVDCKNSSFINREFIFYIGIDSNWTKSVLKKDFIDYDEEFTRNKNNFVILIQQGEQRFFFTTEHTAGEKTLPPFYFNSLLDCDVSSFDDVFSVYDVNSPIEKNDVLNFGIEVLDESVLEKEKVLKHNLSNSKISAYSQCPKKIAYSKLDTGCDMEHFTKGNLIHEFAEFYVCYGEFVKSNKIDVMVDLIIDEMKFITNKYELDVLRTEVKFCLISLMEFIDNLKLDTNVDFLKSEGSSSKFEKNTFSKAFDKKINLNNVEYRFSDNDIKINGFIDLVVNSSEIVDYKTGKLKGVKDIIERSNFNEFETYADFQAYCYFSILRKHSSGNLVFKYFHPLVNVYNSLTDKDCEVDSLKVNYIDMDFIDYFYSDSFFTFVSEISPGYGKDFVKVLENFDLFDKLGLKKSDFYDLDKFILKFQDKIYEYLTLKGLPKNNTEKQQAKNLDDVSKFLTFLFNFKNKYVSKQEEVYYFKDDVNDFEKFVSITLRNYNESVATQFDYRPAVGVDTCKKCEFKSICLKKFEEVERK